MEMIEPYSSKMPDTGWRTTRNPWYSAIFMPNQLSGLIGVKPEFKDELLKFSFEIHRLTAAWIRKTVFFAGLSSVVWRTFRIRKEKSSGS
jgi:hypothetical protein